MSEINEPLLPSKICRICLITNVKMVNLLQNDYKNQYQDVTGLQVSDPANLPNYLCWECAHRLSNCYKFKSRTVLTHCLLSGLLASDNIITESNVLKINRCKNGLESKLTTHTIKPNHVDFKLVEAEINFEIDNDNKMVETNDSENEPITRFLEIKLEPQDSTGKLKEDEKSDSDTTSEEDVESFKWNFETDAPPAEVKVTEKTAKPVTRRRNITKVNETKKDTNLKRVTKKVATLKTIVKKRATNVASKTVKRKWKEAFKKKPVPFIVLDAAIINTTNLNMEEQLQDIEKRKDTENYIYSMFKCDKCFKGFSDEDAFKTHMIRHTDQCGLQECKVCKLRFQTTKGLRHHTSIHAQKYSCLKCSFVTTTRSTAKFHEDYHKGATYECKHCSIKFNQITSLQNHVRLKHPTDIICELCGYSFVSHFGLHLHKKRKHQFDEVTATNEKYSCKECNIDFVSDEALQTHMRRSTKHKNDSKDLPKRPRRSEHKKIFPRKIPQQPIQCEQCDLKLVSAMAYYHHFKRAHPDKTRTNYPSVKNEKCICEVCGRIFTRLALLEDHSYTHLNTEPFKCSHCGKTFERRYKLIEHERKHTAQKQVYICVECGKGFTLAKNMKRHMIIHTGLKAFECEICAKCFKTDGERHAHVTHVHMKKPWPKRNRTRAKQESPQEMEAYNLNMNE